MYLYMEHNSQDKKTPIFINTHPYTKQHFPVLSKGYKSFFKTTFMTLVTVNAHKDAFVFLKLLYVFR